MTPTRIESMWFVNSRDGSDEARAAFTAIHRDGSLTLRRVFGDDGARFDGRSVEVLSTQGCFESVAAHQGRGVLVVEAPEWLANSNRRRVARHATAAQVEIVAPISQSAMLHDISQAGCALYFEDLGGLQVGERGSLRLNTSTIEFTVKNRRSNGHRLVAIAGVAFGQVDPAARAWLGLEVARARMRAGQDLLDRHRSV